MERSELVNAASKAFRRYTLRNQNRGRFLVAHLDAEVRRWLAHEKQRAWIKYQDWPIDEQVAFIEQIVKNYSSGWREQAQKTRQSNKARRAAVLASERQLKLDL